MKKVHRYFIAFLAIMSVSVGMSACKESPATYITEDNIWNIMNEVEDATLNQDIDGVIKHLSPSVVINLTVSSSYGPQKVPMSRDKYREETLKGWSLGSHYEYRHENEEIKISDDGQTAVVEADIIESYVVEGNTVNTTTHERITLQVVDGEIVVTRINAFVRIY